MNVRGKDNDVVGSEVGVIVYYLEPEFRVMLRDSEAIGSEENKEFVEGDAQFWVGLTEVGADVGFNNMLIIFIDLADFPSELFNSSSF